MTSRGTAWLVCSFICVAGVIPTTLAVDAAIKPSEGPADKVLKVGSAGTDIMKCELTEGVFNTFAWKKGTTDTILTVEKKDATPTAIDDKFKLVLHDTIKYNLVVKGGGKVEYVHGGEYTCAFKPGAVTAFKEDITESGTLTVVGDPVCPAAFVGSLEEGTVTINCTLDYSGPDKPDLTMKDSTPADAPGLEVEIGSTGTDGKITLTATATIPAKKDATYTCSSGVTDGVDCTIKVAPATIGSPPEGTSALVGTSADLKCTVIAERDYTDVQWQHETNPIGLGTPTGDPVYKSEMKEKYTISTTTRQDLNVKSVTKEIAGKYQCSVNPPAGLEKYSAELIAIKEKPACSKKDKELTCIVSYAGNKQPIIEWYKADTAIPDLKPTASTEGDYKTATLKATLDDLSKKYTCKVENKGAKVVTSCEGHSSAPGLESKLYQSTLLSLLAMWLYNKVA